MFQTFDQQIKFHGHIHVRQLPAVNGVAIELQAKITCFALGILGGGVRRFGYIVIGLSVVEYPNIQDGFVQVNGLQANGFGTANHGQEIQREVQAPGFSQRNTLERIDAVHRNIIHAEGDVGKVPE